MAASFQFVMRSGPTPGATYPLEGDQLIIGRDASNGVAINDAEISRKHARLTFQGGKYVLEDLGSTNGTFVNGQRLISATVLKSGDVVSLGEQIVLMYEALSTDAGATMIGRKAPARTAVPSPPVAPPPQQHYAPPAQAAPSAPAPAAAPASGSKNLPIFIIGGALLLICACIVIGLYIDSNYLWCTVSLNLIPGCG
jgi:predicted component of type VI protein secretion system